MLEITRQLAAIMFTDNIGNTALIGEDEQREIIWVDAQDNITSMTRNYRSKGFMLL